MKRTPALALASILIVAGSLPAAAAITVSGPFIDSDTGGDWRGAYGECFYLIPDPRLNQIKDPVGPDTCSQAQDQYRYNNCYGGPIFSRVPGESAVDWKIYRNAEDAKVISWHTLAERDGSAQWNPCLNGFRHGTWSNDTILVPRPPQPPIQGVAETTVDGEGLEEDPMTIDLIMNTHGAIRLSYYFTNADKSCRETEFSLKLDGVEMASGSVSDFAAGKYVNFDIDGLKASPQGTTFTFEAWDADGDPTCVHPNDEEMTAGTNTHVSGVFVDFFNSSDSCKKLLRPLAP